MIIFRKKTQTLTQNRHEKQIQFIIPPETELKRQIEIISLSEKDLFIVKGLEPIIHQNITTIVNEFYENIINKPNLQQIIETYSTVDRLKQTFRIHIMEMFAGEINQEFIAKRVRIAHVHVKVGLKTKWYMSAFQNLMNSLIKLVAEKIENKSDLMDAVKAISKLLNFEQQLVLEAYEQETEKQRQLQEEKRSKIQQVGSRAEDLAAIAEETSASIEHLNLQSAAITELARQGSELASEAEYYSYNGMDQLQKSRESMEFTKASVDNIITNSNELNRLSDQIDMVVSIIKSVSDQTNLLSLNAAIESARAGQYGKGFGVVANEIRNLSEQTKKSILEVSKLISETKIQINNVTSSIHEVADIIQNGTKIMLSTNDAFEEILKSMVKNKEQNNLIESEIQSFIKVITEISSASAQVAVIADGLNQATYELN
ncbi:protoglobin domain-containing protein [Lederbergia citri]|uniref:Globin-coupled sensor protein n=1 Tax=Lederbergia citri TaxID=2833580 RepID=A0A942YIF4_9BACI|nr:globin-coupled sensor protein [Lederbergia citri]MBS4197537.1 globin-coupled sensor protein [Lederbergia citri]